VKRKPYFERSEEPIHEQIHQDERRENGQVLTRPLHSSAGNPRWSDTQVNEHFVKKGDQEVFFIVRSDSRYRSHLAPSLARGCGDDEESPVSGLELQIVPTRRTNSGQEMTWLSSW